MSKSNYKKMNVWLKNISSVMIIKILHNFKKFLYLQSTTNRQPQTQKGYTLLELLLAITMFAIVLGIGAPFYNRLQYRNDLDVARNTVNSSLYRAQALSKNSSNISDWGVYIETGSVFLFKGSTYATRDISADEKTTISPNINISGQNEFRYSRITGSPNIYGSLTLTGINNEQVTLQVNERGVVNY